MPPVGEHVATHLLGGGLFDTQLLPDREQEPSHIPSPLFTRCIIPFSCPMEKRFAREIVNRISRLFVEAGMPRRESQYAQRRSSRHASDCPVQSFSSSGKTSRTSIRGVPGLG